jgi:hypothetical protein
MKLLCKLLLVFAIPFIHVHGQEEVVGSEDSLEVITDEEVEEEKIELFGGTRIINGHSVETLSKGVFEFRIEHRFGDIAGDGGGVQTLFGFDQSTDIRFGFEYGISDRFMIGLGRSKGTASLGTFGSPYSALLDGFIKYRLLNQNATGTLFSATVLGTASYTYMKKSSDIASVSHFPKDAYRFAYCSQLILGRKFGERVSVLLMPTLVYRNYVASNDENALFSLGSAVRFAATSKVGIILEYFANLQEDRDINLNGIETKNSFGIGVEWITFGHTFTVNLTNSVGFGETQFIPYTFQDWSKGQYRLGFCIGRKYMRE